jgi:hypothetical protein
MKRRQEAPRGRAWSPRADGATHLLLDPLELIEKLTLD